MRWITSAALALSLFSVLPVPQVPWQAASRARALACFPLVGAACALALWGWAGLCSFLALPPLLRGAGLCLLPVWVTGGIHLDGYADTSDALASHAAPQRKREILHDPHCGAFAVLRLCSCLVASFALCTALLPDARALGCLGLSFLLSRTLSSLALLCFPLAGEGGIAAALVEGAKGRGLLCAALAALALGLCLLGGWKGFGMLLAAAGVFLHYRAVSIREFGGTSGDLAGWFLVRAEFWMLAALVLAQYGEAKL